MAVLRRIAAGLLFGVALITFLLTASGTIGVWIAKATIDATSIALIDTVADYLDLALQTMDTLNERVSGVEQTVDVLRSRLPVLRPDRSDGPVVQGLQQVVSEEVQPALEQLRLRTQRLRDSLERFNQRIDQLNRLPGVEFPTLAEALPALDAQLAQIEAARTQAQQMLTALETRDPVLLQAASDQLAQSLDQASTTLAEGRARVEVTSAALNDFSQALTFWSTVSTTALSGLLAIFALGQLSLAVQAWRWMRARPARR